MKHGWSKFWWQDWQSDVALRMCSPGARGVWMDMLCVMAAAQPRGYLLVNGGEMPSMEMLGRLFGTDAQTASDLIEELERNGVFSRVRNPNSDPSRGPTTGTIFCRRMIRDSEASEAGRKNISKRWNGSDNPQTVKQKKDPNRDPFTKMLEAKMLEAKKERKGGKGVRGSSAARSGPQSTPPPDGGRDPAGTPSLDAMGTPPHPEVPQQAAQRPAPTPRANGTNPRAKGTNPRAGPVNAIDQIRRDWQLGTFLAPILDDDDNPNPKALR